jgi:hypothetical protein
VSKLPLTYTLTLTPQRGSYVATVTAWGIPTVGGYGSLWCRTLELVDVPAHSDPSYVLSAFAAALQAQLARPQSVID